MRLDLNPGLLRLCRRTRYPQTRQSQPQHCNQTRPRAPFLPRLFLIGPPGPFPFRAQTMRNGGPRHPLSRKRPIDPPRLLPIENAFPKAKRQSDVRHRARGRFRKSSCGCRPIGPRKGCAILQPYDMEVGAGTFHPATTLRALGTQALGGGLCAAVAPTDRRALWRKPEPVAALLPVSGHHQTLAAGPAGPVSGLARGDRHRSRRCTTSALSRMTGKARRLAPGAWAGKSGATAWKCRSSPISSRSAGMTATRSRAS